MTAYAGHPCPPECGAVAIAAPGGPTVVPFRVCCAKALMRARGSGPVICGFESSLPLATAPAGTVLVVEATP